MSGILEKLSLPEKLIARYEVEKLTLLSDNPVLNGFREQAINAFRKTGFPSRKNEEYKYLTFDKTLDTGLDGQTTALQHTGIDLFLKDEPTLAFPSYKAVLVNGVFSSENSSLENLPAGMVVGSLSEAINTKNIQALSTVGTLAKSDSDPFLAINSALFTDGLFVLIPGKAVLDKPLQIIQVSTGNEPIFIQPRLLVIAEKNSSAEIVHSFVSHQLTARLFSNTATEIQLEEGALLSWDTIQNESAEASLVNTMEAHIRSRGVFNAVTITLGGGIVRNNLNCILDAPHTEAHLCGYYHPGENQVFDNHTLMDHRFPDCQSNELYKGVISSNGTAIFNGKVHVHPQAQKTNAFQSNKNILLSDEATVNTKPQLEIYADDVKCSHGSSTGYLDPEQLFYLRSRGISEEMSRALLLHAYSGEILEKIRIPVLRETLQTKLEELFYGTR